jgi:hypothetical protein
MTSGDCRGGRRAARPLHLCIHDGWHRTCELAFSFNGLANSSLPAFAFLTPPDPNSTTVPPTPSCRSAHSFRLVRSMRDGPVFVHPPLEPGVNSSAIAAPSATTSRSEDRAGSSTPRLPIRPDLTGRLNQAKFFVYAATYPSEPARGAPSSNRSTSAASLSPNRRVGPFPTGLTTRAASNRIDREIRCRGSRRWSAPRGGSGLASRARRRSSPRVKSLILTRRIVRTGRARTSSGSPGPPGSERR